MSEEITSLKALEYFEGQCVAFFEFPDNFGNTSSDEDLDFVQGVFSYQKNSISFSFLISVKEILDALNASIIDPRFKTFYILMGTKRCTIHNALSQRNPPFSFNSLVQISLEYEWLFDDWIDPEAIKGEYFVCRTSYLESFFTKKQHLAIDPQLQKGDIKEENQDGFTLRSFYMQEDFLSQKFEDSKIRANRFYKVPAPEQHRFLECQYDIYLECNIVFENLDRLALTAEAIKNFFVLIYAYSNFDIQIEYICFKPQGREHYITALRNTFAKDKKPIIIDPYGITIRFWEIDNFSAVLERWIDFYIQNKDSQYVPSILDIINKKEQTIHLYSDLLLLVSMIEGFIGKQGIIKKTDSEQQAKLDELDNAIQLLKKSSFSEKTAKQYKNIIKSRITNATLREKFFSFFEEALSRTECKKTKNYFCDKQEDICKVIAEYRNILAHGGDLKLDRDKIKQISEAFADLKQIVIDYFFGEIGLSKSIGHNIGFSMFLDRREYASLQNRENITNE